MRITAGRFMKNWVQISFEGSHVSPLEQHLPTGLAVVGVSGYFDYLPLVFIHPSPLCETISGGGISFSPNKPTNLADWQLSRCKDYK